MDITNVFGCLIVVEVFYLAVGYHHSIDTKRKPSVKPFGADGCHLQTLSTCLCKQDEKGSFKVDCSGSGLEEIPGLCPSNVIQLDLSFNNINVIRDSAFKNVGGGELVTLKILSLSNNNISTIETGAFKGLLKLETLLLYNNSLCVAFLREPFMFAPFSEALKVLDIRKNINDDYLSCQQYPGRSSRTFMD